MPTIVNFKYADLLSAVAAADMSQLGLVCKVTGTATGGRQLTPLLDTDDALVLSGNYAVAMKYGTDAFEVDSSTAPSFTGSRLVTILSGDMIVEARKGTIIRYTAAELDNSLNPGSGGTTPAVGDDLGIKGAKWATIAAATGSGIATPVVGRVHEVIGTDIKVALVY